MISDPVLRAARKRAVLEARAWATNHLGWFVALPGGGRIVGYCAGFGLYGGHVIHELPSCAGWSPDNDDRDVWLITPVAQPRYLYVNFREITLLDAPPDLAPRTT